MQKKLRRAYYACVSYIDQQLGRILTALEDSGYANNTVVSLLSDHGFQLGEHGLWEKHTNFEYATRTPMMIKVPGITDKSRNPIITSGYAELIDMFPTLVEAATGTKLRSCSKGSVAARKQKTCSQGVSLLPLAVKPNQKVKTAAFSQYRRGRTMGHSVVTRVGGKEYRYTKWCDFVNEQVSWNKCSGEELYDHSRDPGENDNVATLARSAAIVKKLFNFLRDHVEA